MPMLASIQAIDSPSSLCVFQPSSLQLRPSTLQSLWLPSRRSTWRDRAQPRPAWGCTPRDSKINARRARSMARQQQQRQRKGRVGWAANLAIHNALLFQERLAFVFVLRGPARTCQAHKAVGGYRAQRGPSIVNWRVCATCQRGSLVSEW